MMGNLYCFLLLFGVFGVTKVFGISSVEQDIWNSIKGGQIGGKFIPGDTSKSIDLSVGISLISLSDYQESSGGVRILLWLSHEFKTPGVSWDPSKFSDVKMISIPSKMIWLPDIVPYQQTGLTANFDSRVLLTKDGHTTWIPSYKLVATCASETDGPAYPKDRKVCTLKVGSWVYNGLILNLKMKAASKEKYFDPLLGNWKYIKLTQEFKNMTYPCCPEPYPAIEYKITIERVATYFSLTTAIPGFLTGLVIVFLYFLPPSSAARIISQIICLLVIVVISLFNVSDFMKGEKMVSAAKYLICAMVLDFIAILWSIVASILWIQTQDKGSENSCIDSLLSNLECICCLPSGSNDGEGAKSDHSGKQNKFSAVQRFCLILDRIFGLLYLVIFIFLFCCMGF